MMNCSIPLSYNLRLYRQNLSKTQERMALDCGISLRLYQKLEAGNGNPTLSTLELISKFLKCNVSDLLRLNILRIIESKEQFIKKFETQFLKLNHPIYLQSLEGIILWKNESAQSILPNENQHTKLDLLNSLPDHSKKLLSVQLECERRGLNIPYINSHLNDPGKESFFRCYPTAILPMKGSNPYFSAVFSIPTREDNEALYYQFCYKLLKCL